ncbi:M3 family metallopeptidase [Burkholderiaceae bacterium DAT-1]|nr:M3 family metallopeptidase [Burkholderiaceae bacterium DAT-1]
MISNPLLDQSGLPHFDTIRPEHVTEALDTLLARAREAIDIAAKIENPDWDSYVVPMDDASETLYRAWNQVSHLQAVVNTPALREAYNANLPKLAQFSTEVSQNLALLNGYKKLVAHPDFASWSPARRKVLTNTLRDFRLGGAELDEAGKQRFAEISAELAQLSASFEQHLLDATDSFEYLATESELAGVPDDILSMCKARAEANGKSGYSLSLHMPCYLPVMQFAQDRSLRERMYRAYMTRASEFGKADLDNGPLIDRILALKTEMAQLLGFNTYADLSLETKMAESPAKVLTFLRDLAARIKPFAQKDRQELEAFARDTLATPDLQAWDIAYTSEKLKEARYSFSEQEVKQYFTEPKVLDGLFSVIHDLYGLTICEDHAPSWHADVRFYRLEDAAGKLVGQFYLDLYARDAKRGGAWMDECRNRRDLANGTTQTPIAYLTCNFGRGQSGKPATFSHDEVITLFHEMGHGLHLLLTEVGVQGVSGINGVEWDAVELPSQFMENFCWEWARVQQMTAHIDTGDHLPRALFDKMLAAKNYQSGMFSARQLEFGLFDMTLHGDFNPSTQTVRSVLDTVRAEVAVNFPPENTRFANSFSHIFAGGYAAGYYSYKWAEVLSADAYAAFEEAPEHTQQTGERFRKEILAVGGSRPALESFVAFRGRMPQIDALLRHSGMQ